MLLSEYYLVPPLSIFASVPRLGLTTITASIYCFEAVSLSGEDSIDSARKLSDKIDRTETKNQTRKLQQNRYTLQHQDM